MSVYLVNDVIGTSPSSWGAAGADTLRLRDLTGDIVEVARYSVRPDPLDTQLGLPA